MAVILEDIDSAPGCAYCRLRFQYSGITGLLNREPNRCKINMKKIDQYCDMTQVPSKPDWCPVKAAIPIRKDTYMVLDVSNTIDVEVSHDN